MLLAATPESVAASELMARLDGEQRMLLSALLEEPWGVMDVDAIVAGAINKLSGRKLEAELKDLERRMPLAPESEKPALTNRVDVLSRQISQLDPGRWNVIRRGGRVGS